MRSTAAERRQRRWARCRWPHEVLSPEAEARITAHIVRWRPFIRKRAARLARGDSSMASEIEQAAMIRIWRFGSAEVEQRNDKQLRAVLRLTMGATHRAEKAA